MMKKFLKRSLLIVLAAILLAQIPFAYRRYKFGQLRNKINEIAAASQEIPKPTNPNFIEYKGIIHAHTNLGGHSTGRFEELVNASNANDLDFVLMTEHYSQMFDTASLTLNGVYGKTLFVGGNEIDTSDADRFLMIPGSADAFGLAKVPTASVIEKLHAENRLALVTYPETLKSADANFDGIEVFSLYTASKQLNPFITFFDLIWSGYSYPELVFASNFKRPDDNLAKYDATAARRKASLFAGTDAHSNVGFHIFGDDAGHKWIDIKLDRYETMFRIVRNHILVPKDKPLTRDNLIDAIKQGHSFIGFDALGDTSGFSFVGSSCEQTLQPMGSNLELCNDHGFSTASFQVVSPLKGRIVVFRNGEIFTESSDSGTLEFSTKQSGSYRVEVYQNALGAPFDTMPWIISNPIYVR